FYKVNRGEKGDITSLEYLGESKTKYGAITVTWKEQEYKINYSLVFSDFKSFCYMSDALNAIGGIDFHDWGEVVNNTTGRINPSQAKEYHDSIVESALVGDRGIPRKWLYILIIGMAISGVIAGIMGLSYVGLSQKSGDEHTYLCQLEPTHKGCPPPPKAKDTSSSNIVKDTPSIQKGADK
ncbi:MAG TPA: hypothetical protein VNS32_10185, partial [Flavisolibacter sp.]|nr:hypothetical protein [Flavisolibacter sp.]